MSDTMSFSLSFSVIGILIVFVALAIIVMVISLVRRLDAKWEDREAAQKKAAGEKEQNIDSLTLVLITAAVATMLQGRYFIRSVKKLLPVDAMSGPWSSQGRAILHGSHVHRRGR